MIAVAGIAACMMTTFIHKHFFGSTEVAMYKSQRTVPDHSDAHRVDVQNSRRNLLGNMAWMDLNKSKMTLFPFSYVPREGDVATRWSSHTSYARACSDHRQFPLILTHAGPLTY